MKYFLLFFFCLIKISNSKSQNLVYTCAKIDTSHNLNFTIVDVLDEENMKQLYNPVDIIAIEEGINKIKCFLFSNDISFIDIHDGWDEKIYNVLKKLLSHYGSPLSNLKYELISLRKLNNENIEFSLSVYFYVKQACLSLYQGTFHVIYNVSSGKLKIPYSQSDQYKPIEIGNIQYYIKREMIDEAILIKTVLFKDSLIKSISKSYNKFIPPKKNLKYVLSDYFGLYEIIGLTHFLNTSNYNKSIYTIFDAVSNGFYKHEIVHYVFTEYNFSNFINEGLASFKSNESKFNESMISNVKEIATKIRSDTIYKNQINTDSVLLEHPGLSSERYNIAAILLWKFYQLKKEKTFYKTLFEELLPLNDKEALQSLKTKLKIEDLGSFILNNQALLVENYLPR